MPPKRRSERALPARKTTEARAASKETTSAANGTKSTAPKKSKTCTIATPASRKRGRSPNTGISSTKTSKVSVSLRSNPQQPPPSTRKPDDKAASGNGSSLSTRTRPATAHSPQPPLKATRTRSRVSATTQAAVPGPITTAADTASTIETTEGDQSRITGAAGGNYSEGLSLLNRYFPFPSSMSMNSSSARVALEWGTTGATVFSMFLAEAQAHLVRQCCRQLAQLTTSTTPAFLHAASLGEAALATSPPPSKPANANSCSGDQDLLTPVDPLIDRQEQTYRTLRATIAASCTLGHRSCQVLWGPRGSGKHRILRLLAQDVRCTPNTFVMELQGRLLSSDEAALGVIAEQMLAFLRSPQSAQLRASHHLLRTGEFEFGQLFHFERRMQANGTPATANKSQGVTARPMHDKDAPLPQTYRFSRLHSGRHAQGVVQRRPQTSTRAPPAKHSHGEKGSREARRNLGRRAPNAHAESDTDLWSGDISEDASADEDDGQGSSVMVTSTTTYLTGGATSALPHLQRALLLLKSQGCSIVVCVRDIDVFGIRCDQLLYVLAGLMHDSDASRGGGSACGGGGLSLVLASAAPDIRQLEKRLSSRLTCETRYVPLLPWSLRNMLAATLHTIAQDALNQVRTKEITHLRADLVEMLRSESLRRRQGTDGVGDRDRASNREKALVEKTMSNLQTQLHAMDAELRELRVQRRHLSSLLNTEAATTLVRTTSSNKAVCPTLGHLTASGWRSSLCSPPPAPQKQAPASENSTVPSFTAARTWSLNSLLAHPSLTLEVQCVMCEELLRQLKCPGGERQTQGIAGADTLGGHDPSSLVQLMTKLSSELEVNSSSSSSALTVLASYLCKTSSGTVDFLGRSGRGVLLSWLRARLQHERIPAATINAALAAQASAAHSGSVPPMVLAHWLEAAESAALRSSESEGGRINKAAMDVICSSHAVCHRTRPELSPLSLLPPQIHDLLADGQLVGMGYGSREVLLVLFYMHIHHTNGVRQRTVADLLEDVSSSLGTKAAAALDREAFRLAIRHLCRWKLLRVVEVHSQLLEMCGSDARLRDFLLSLLSKKQNWCETKLGLDAREIMRFRNLL